VIISIINEQQGCWQGVNLTSLHFCLLIYDFYTYFGKTDKSCAPTKCSLNDFFDFLDFILAEYETFYSFFKKGFESVVE